MTESTVQVEYAPHYDVNNWKNVFNEPDIVKEELYDVVNHVVSNYVIVKKIIRNLEWRDRSVCSGVCQLWRDIVKTMSYTPVAIDYILLRSCKSSELVVSEKSYCEPMLVLTFCKDLEVTNKCSDANVCMKPCQRNHKVLDIVFSKLCHPKKDNMVAISASQLIYMPPAKYITSKYTQKTMRSKNNTHCGIIIPKIPNVKWHELSCSIINNVEGEIYDKLDEIMDTQLIKGVLLFSTIHLDMESAGFLTYIQNKQGRSYALGGCIINETLTRDFHMNKLSLFTLVVFTVDHINVNKTDFEMYSLILQCIAMDKTKIGKEIETFSNAIPKFHQSCVVKLSCVGRNKLHAMEQDIFRSYFPETTIVGCYGDGEIGMHEPNLRMSSPSNYDDLMYSYSSIFVFFGWGKM